MNENHEKKQADDEVLNAEYEVNQHARRLAEALEGLRWGLSRTTHRIDRVSARARQPIELLRRQPKYVSIPIFIGTVVAVFFGMRFYRQRSRPGSELVSFDS